jgi:hypothetical protein
MHPTRVLILAVLAAFALLSTRASARPLDEWTIATLNEGCVNAEGASLAASVPSDLLMRAWFKWEKARDYQADKFVLPAARARGASFGGGTTVSALYRQENGLTPEQWRRLATRDPFGHIIPAWNDKRVAHGALSSEEYLDYVLKFCYAQIDAGVDNLFMDEVEACYSGFEGFDDPAMAKFAAWLIHKYCDGQGWAPKDARWRDKFGLDLADPEMCPDGTIKSFNYRAYLYKRDFAADPYAEDNPLRLDFGWPGSGEDTFWGWRNDWAWKYLCDHLRDYAKKKGREVLLTANGLHKYVDYQVSGFWIEWVGDRKHVTTNASYLRKYRRAVLTAYDLAGKQVPVVFFHDWGFEGFPFGELSPDNRIRWIKIYAPEVFAAGGLFCWPVNIAAPEDLEVMKHYIAWYDTHRALFHGGAMVPTRQVMVSDSHVTTALWELGAQKKRVIHFINHSYDRDIVPVDNLAVTLPSGSKPLTATWVSPEIPADRPVTFAYADGALTFKTPRIEGYGALVLSYDELPKNDQLAARTVELLTRGAWARPGVNRFTVTADGKVNNPDQLYSCLQGRLHPDLRNNPTFVVDYPADGKFLVHVNSVAASGANLEFYLDGKLVLRQDLPDLDKQNDGGAAEYDQEYGIDVPRGKHEVRLDNTGGDWLSVDYFLLINYK